MTVRYNLSDVKLSNLLCFFSVAEAHGLVYPHPSGEISVLHNSLPDDGRSISRNAANINELVQTKMFFRNILQLKVTFQLNLAGIEEEKTKHPNSLLKSHICRIRKLDPAVNEDYLIQENSFELIRF